MRSLALAAAVTLVACATAAEPRAPAPASFHGVRRLALVRLAVDRAGRGRDPLDGLDQTLRARGFETRVLELLERRNPSELAGVERLFGTLELRASTPLGERLGPQRRGDVGRDAGAAVASLGVDAVATYHRLEHLARPPPRAPGPALPGAVFPAPSPPERGPLGALALVDRAGRVAIFPWGATTQLDDPSTPVNAAEAIDLLVRALAGEAEAEDQAQED